MSTIPDFEIRRVRSGEFGIEALSQRAQAARGMGPGDTKVFVRWHEAVPFVEAAEAEGSLCRSWAVTTVDVAGLLL